MNEWSCCRNFCAGSDSKWRSEPQMSIQTGEYGQYLDFSQMAYWLYPEAPVRLGTQVRLVRIYHLEVKVFSKHRYGHAMDFIMVIWSFSNSCRKMIQGFKLSFKKYLISRFKLSFSLLSLFLPHTHTCSSYEDHCIFIWNYYLSVF